MKLSLIIPCYNEEAALSLFYNNLSAVLNGLTGYESEIIFVDDGSTDGTIAKIKTLANQDKRVKYISFSRNFGKEAAMLAGFKRATGDYTAVMDADMQDPPELLPEMLEILQKGEYDSVAARRKNRKGEPLIRSAFSRLFYKIISFKNFTVQPNARDFRLMNRKMLNAVLSMSEVNRFTKGIFSWVGFKTYWICFENAPRAAGKTKWNFKKLFNYSVSGIVNFSDAPLKAITKTGLALLGISFTALIIFLVLGLCGVWYSPVATLAATATFLTGIIVLALGIIGRYIGNVYLETKNRPQFIVNEDNFTEEK